MRIAQFFRIRCPPSFIHDPTDGEDKSLSMFLLSAIVPMMLMMKEGQGREAKIWKLAEQTRHAGLCTGSTGFTRHAHRVVLTCRAREGQKIVDPVYVIGTIGHWRYELAVRYPPVNAQILVQQRFCQLSAHHKLDGCGESIIMIDTMESDQTG